MSKSVGNGNRSKSVLILETEEKHILALITYMKSEKQNIRHRVEYDKLAYDIERV